MQTTGWHLGASFIWKKKKKGESYLKGTTRLTCVNVKLTPKTKKKKCRFCLKMLGTFANISSNAPQLMNKKNTQCMQQCQKMPCRFSVRIAAHISAACICPWTCQETFCVAQLALQRHWDCAKLLLVLYCFVEINCSKKFQRICDL